LCNRAAQCVGVHVVREQAPAVDLDHREPLAVRALECRVAGDVDLAQLEAQLVLELAHLRERPLAEVAAARVVDDDFRYG
jgi:hypothetical protein